MLPQPSMRPGRAAVLEGFALLSLVACGRDHGDVPRDVQPVALAASASSGPSAGSRPPAAPPPPASDCGHSVCVDNLFIDTAPGAACAAGSVCTLTLTLVATGDYHVNDEYPYRFKADDAQGLTFLGTDEGGKNIFSKGAGDWKKIDARSGAMTVQFTPQGRGPATVGGVFRMSVCSGATCQLEQSRLSAAVAVN